MLPCECLSGLAGVLAPGARGSVELEFRGSDSPSPPTLTFTAFVEDASHPVDWIANKNELRPPTISPETWDVLFDKFLARGGVKLADSIEVAIEQRLREPWDRPTGASVGRVRPPATALDGYAGHLVSTIKPRLEGIKVVLDCAHGAAWQVGPKALRDAGAEVVAICAEPDGTKAQENLDADMAALYGNLDPNSFFVTRMMGQLSRPALANDLQIGAAMDQMYVSNYIEVSATVGTPPECPPDPCAEGGGGAGTGGTGGETGTSGGLCSTGAAPAGPGLAYIALGIAGIAGALRRLDPGLDVALVEIKTLGDRDRNSPLAAIGGTGVFTKEIQRALLDGSVDVAVHSLKDLPTEVVPGLLLAAVPVREQVFDGLIAPRHGTLGDP